MITKRIKDFEDTIDVLEDLKESTDGVSIGSALDELSQFMQVHLEDVIDQLKDSQSKISDLQDKIEELEKEIENHDSI